MHSLLHVQKQVKQFTLSGKIQTILGTLLEKFIKQLETLKEEEEFNLNIIKVFKEQILKKCFEMISEKEEPNLAGFCFIEVTLFFVSFRIFTQKCWKKLS